MSPVDAQELGVENGDVVQVTSRYGTCSISVRITDVVEPRQLFATFHSPEVFVNRLTSMRRDNYTDTPEYKVTAVRVTRISSQTPATPCSE
jgi:formate dehydrogenase major subunit